MTEPTRTQDYKVLKAIEFVEHRLPGWQQWSDIAEAALERVRATCPSVLEEFDITFRLESGVLDDHLKPVYKLRSAVDRLADLSGADV